VERENETMNDGQMMSPLLYQKVIKDGTINRMKAIQMQEVELTPSSRRLTTLETPNII